MKTDDPTPSDQPDLSLLIEPESPEAGAPMSIAVTTDVPPDGKRAKLLDAEGAERATAGFGDPDETGRVTARLDTTAPDTAGDHAWTVILVDTDEDAPLARTDAAFSTRPHDIRPTVWGIPSAIPSGTAFRVNIGLRCVSGCSSAHWGFVIADESGTEILAGQVGDSPAPGTEALHFAEIELNAPRTEGQHVWQIRPTCPEHTLPHVAVPADLNLNVVRQPEHVIRVRAVDALTGSPVNRAKVVAHPFRALTDADGRAEIAVPRGSYTVFVSGQQYFPVRQQAEIAADVEIHAEMYLDRAFDEVDQWA